MARTDTSHERVTRFFGLSTDTKPTNAMVDSTFTETDTQKKFVYDGLNWTRMPTEVVEQLPSATATDLRQTATTDDLLSQIVTQLKIQNAHLSRITDEELDETDIPVEVR